MPKAVSRPSFATSSTDFALPASSSNSVASSSSITLDEPNLLLQRFRRPSLLVPKTAFLSETRLGSPLASSFTFHSRRRSQSAMFTEECESDKEKMSSYGYSGSSGDPIVPSKNAETNTCDIKDKPRFSKPPSTPPRRPSVSSPSIDMQDTAAHSLGKRLSFPIKPPRILNLLAESRPEESEVKSEAAFQRLITSCSELPRTPRPATDRGRYPEEAGQEDTQREETPSDDEDTDEAPFAFSALGGSDPIPIRRASALTSASTDDLPMSVSQTSSNGTLAMDVDVPPSPSLSAMMSTPSNGWRYTPPPTTSAVRSNKRKLDDRFDPYPASKRRAVSPSLSYLRDAHSTVGSPMNMNGRNNRLPISIPITIPNSTVNSATSSPTIGGSYSGSFSRSMSITSSPTLRSTMLLASPILRPVPRLAKRGEEEERGVEGAGEGVNGLTLA